MFLASFLQVKCNIACFHYFDLHYYYYQDKTTKKYDIKPNMLLLNCLFLFIMKNDNRVKNLFHILKLKYLSQ